MKRRSVLFVIVCLGFAIPVLSGSGSQAATSIVGRSFSPPAANSDGKITVLIYYDMEGISGLTDIRAINFSSPQYDQVRPILTAEVNAVIEGLFAGGADGVDVVDAHGSGNPETDILLDKMDPRARHVCREAPFDAYMDLTAPGAYDAVAALCMHSRTGGGGFASHTYTLGMDWILNDQSVCESDIIAFSWGRVDVPLILVSGDDKLKEQLAWMPWLEYVQVKKAKAADDAIPRPLADVCADLRQAAARAVRNLAQNRAVKLREPIKAQLRAVRPARLDYLDKVPGLNYRDGTVTFVAADIKEAYTGITALIRVATRGYRDIMMEVLKTMKLDATVEPEFMRQLFQRWMDVESGRWSPPKPPERGAEKKKYYGY